MKKYHIIPIIFWIGFSLFVMVLSYKLGLEGFHNPGPGLMPFLMGALLLIISLYVLISALFWKEANTRSGGRRTKTNRFKQNNFGFSFNVCLRDTIRETWISDYYVLIVNPFVQEHGF